MNKDKEATTDTESGLQQLGKLSTFDTEATMEYSKLGGPGDKAA